MNKYCFGFFLFFTNCILVANVNAQFGFFNDVVRNIATTIDQAVDEAFIGNADATSSHWNPPVKAGERERLNKNYETTIVQGAVVGGGVGVLASQILGLGVAETALVTLTTSAAGAYIGKNFADKFEDMAQSKSKTEKQLTALRKNHENLARKLDTVERNIAYINSEIEILNRQLARDAITEHELASFTRKAIEELDDASDAFSKTKLTYAEAEETYNKIMESRNQEVNSLGQESYKIREDLKLEDKRAERLSKERESLIEKLT